jgi:hypothetical protein
VIIFYQRSLSASTHLVSPLEITTLQAARKEKLIVQKQRPIGKSTMLAGEASFRPHPFKKIALSSNSEKKTPESPPAWSSLEVKYMPVHVPLSLNG